MAIIRAKKIREMNEKELEEKIKELKLELSKEMGSSEIGGTVKNPGKIREIKKTIARIMTIRNERK
ncbi:MAG: 50S ribosomal protein L29 [Candidatus Aenigmatarchaeota archaeon]